MHNLRVASYVLFGNLTEDHSLGDRLSNSSEELLQRGRGGYIGGFAENKQTNHGVEHQKITANYKTQISQVNDFSAFLCKGRCKSLGSLKLFLR